MTSLDPGDHNARVWASGRLLRHYRDVELRPVEATLFEHHRDALRGDVVELGCGTGRIIGRLAADARSCRGVDISEAMLAEARRRHPAVTFSEGDVRDLSLLDDCSADVVIAGCNVLDILDHDCRRATLRAVRRILRPGGVLLFSSHNRTHLPWVPGPWHISTARLATVPLQLLRLPLAVLRHRRLRTLERTTPEYAIVADGAHHFALVHYFIAAEVQARQLRAEGLEPLECIGMNGEPVAWDEPPDDQPELHYAARRPV